MKTSKRHIVKMTVDDRQAWFVAAAMRGMTLGPFARGAMQYAATHDVDLSDYQDGNDRGMLTHPHQLLMDQDQYEFWMQAAERHGFCFGEFARASLRLTTKKMEKLKWQTSHS